MLQVAGCMLRVKSSNRKPATKMIIQSKQHQI